MRVKVYYVLITCLFFLYNVSTNAQEKINKFDLNGKRDGIWKKYYPNNNIRYQGTFKAGKEVGVFKYYDITNATQPTIIKTFKPNSSLATVNFYTVKGILKSTGTMDGKKRIGTWLYYYPNGKTLMIEENYKNNELEGSYKSYYRTGKISELLNYTSGKLNGNIKRYADNGVLLEDLNYINGNLNGPAIYYAGNGKIISSGNYKNNERVGTWVVNEEDIQKKSNNLKQ
ncbi:toxin-antitoxin system YwqK family antitoxin [Lutibacter sp. A64]|uniref:toxin-antitoxin system YwqK family antitoxin n=1 Tax=Lutibacter sp. A64 TaxID=2918526 RepID=UPI001F0653E0|nr:toxin-antitoxin system YwqK family antitoxin [Lutibacter sp. A64]UMB54428.1 toxin-antitoxin system YwqK family antitoxin [Lutibacter sp. A64]